MTKRAGTSFDERLNSIAGAVLELNGSLVDRISELHERLRVIEGDIERIQKHIGVLATKAQAPMGTYEQQWYAPKPDGGF